MFFLAIAALGFVFAEWCGLLSSRTPATPRLRPWVWVVLLVCSYVAQLAIIVYGARHQYPLAPWRATMPFSVVDDRDVAMLHGNAVTAAMLALGALQAYAL